MPRSSSRFGLTDINFLTVDAQNVLTPIEAAYEEAAGRGLAEGDPVYLFLETIADVIISLRNEVNLAARETTLSYATGGFLDAIGIMTGTKRLTATHAQTTLRFTLDHPVEVGNYQIPAGTTVSNGQHIFRTDELLIIPAGEQSGTVIATAEKEGTASNGILPGFVTQLATPMPNLTVTNITTTNGSADAESDEDFAERISLAPETFASAGHRQAYIGHAMAAHPDIAAVSVTAPRPGVVDVRPILKNGELPSEEILELVRTALNDESVRPLTDTVIVASPDPEEYEINVEWSIAKSDEALVATIKQQVAQAIETYRLWQRTMPGRDINPTKLISLMEQAGKKLRAEELLMPVKPA